MTKIEMDADLVITLAGEDLVKLQKKGRIRIGKFTISLVDPETWVILYKEPRVKETKQE